MNVYREEDIPALQLVSRLLPSTDEALGFWGRTLWQIEMRSVVSKFEAYFESRLCSPNFETSGRLAAMLDCGVVALTFALGGLLDILRLLGTGIFVSRVLDFSRIWPRHCRLSRIGIARRLTTGSRTACARCELDAQLLNVAGHRRPCQCQGPS